MQIDVVAFRLKLYPRDYVHAKTFYAEILGFPLVNEWDRGNDDKGAMFQVGPAVIEILTPEKNYTPVVGADVSLEVPDVQALWHGLQNKVGVIFPLRHNAWGDSSFCIKDPEGFELTFFTKDKT